jgi:hypothetical protein
MFQALSGLPESENRPWVDLVLVLYLNTFSWSRLREIRKVATAIANINKTAEHA